MKKSVFFLIPVIILVLAGCPDPGVDPKKEENKKEEKKEEPPLQGKEVVFEMKFNDDGEWAEHEDWSRWYYNYQDKDDSFDLSSMLTNDKVYVLTYSFSTNVNIDELTTYFFNMDTIVWNWQAISQYVTLKNNIEKGKEYTGKIVYIPQSNAAGLLPEDTRLRFDAHNRNVNTAAVIYFYQFDLDLVDKQNSLETWTVSGKDFTINEGTFAETLTSFSSKSNVLHIKPSYDSDNYYDFVMQYDLNDYKGKTVEIKMSMDVYLSKAARIAWQINSKTPYYPVICGVVGTDPAHPDPHSGPAMTANIWHSLKGSNIITVPANVSDENSEGRTLYLSGMQIEDAEAYFANVVITIKEPDTITFEETGNYTENGDYDRWEYSYQDEDNLFDISTMLTNNKVYVLTYSFTSDIDIDQLGAYFYNFGAPDYDWKMISNWGKIDGNIEANKQYSGKVVFIPTEGASGCSPEITYFRLGAKNRTVSTPANLSFYEFKFEQMDKEVSLETWTVSGKDFTITAGTLAETLSNFNSKSNVLHIKPSYGFDEYTDFLMKYELTGYKGQTIKIDMSMDVYLRTPSWIAWQINSSPTPFYPVVCGTVSESTYDHPVGPALTANTWHTITGSYTFTVPNTNDDNGKQLYLSGMQIAGAEAYFANATITITVQP
jgi:hypothetical protein